MHARATQRRHALFHKYGVTLRTSGKDLFLCVWYLITTQSELHAHGPIRAKVALLIFDAQYMTVNSGTVLLVSGLALLLCDYITFDESAGAARTRTSSTSSNSSSASIATSYASLAYPFWRPPLHAPR